MVNIYKVIYEKGGLKAKNRHKSILKTYKETSLSNAISRRIIINKKRLYVIGNGFGCMYGLPTKVSDFERHLSEKHVYNEIDDANEILNTYGVHWCEYEEGLSDIDTEEIYSRNVQSPDYLSDHESDR